MIFPGGVPYLLIKIFKKIKKQIRTPFIYCPPPLPNRRRAFKDL